MNSIKPWTLSNLSLEMPSTSQDWDLASVKSAQWDSIVPKKELPFLLNVLVDSVRLVKASLLNALQECTLVLRLISWRHLTNASSAPTLNTAMEARSKASVTLAISAISKPNWLVILLRYALSVTTVPLLLNFLSDVLKEITMDF